jgi:hypothetical protein
MTYGVPLKILLTGSRGGTDKILKLTVCWNLIPAGYIFRSEDSSILKKGAANTSETFAALS